MMITTNPKGLCKAAVVFTLLLIFGIDASAQTNRFDERVGTPSTRRNGAEEIRRLHAADTTPHKTRFVRVEPGVWLEVVDWGGERQAADDGAAHRPG